MTEHDLSFLDNYAKIRGRIETGALAHIERLWDQRSTSEAPVILARRAQRCRKEASIAERVRIDRLREAKDAWRAKTRAEAEERLRELDRIVLGRAGPSLRKIIIGVCSASGFPPHMVLSRSRALALAHCRQEIMWLARRETKLSFPEIGRRMGGLHHTTVLHGIRAHARRNGLPLTRGGVDV